MEGQIAQEAPAVAPDTAISGGEGTSSGAPVAEAPVAEAPEAPAPEAPIFPDADEYDWDAWDGTTDTLPEEIRGWHSKFDAGWTTKVSEHEQALAKAKDSAKAWENMFNSLADGAEDPRISQSQQALTSLQAEFAQYRQEMDEREARYTAYVEKETERYFNMVADRNPELIEKMNATEGADDVIMGLMGEDDTGLDFEEALKVWDRGEDAVAFAQQAVKDGVSSKYIKDLVEMKFPKEAPAPPPAPVKQPKSVDLVTGAEPITRSAPVPEASKAPQTLDAARQAAAQRAWERMTGKRR